MHSPIERAAKHTRYQVGLYSEPERLSWRYSKAGIVTNELVPLSHSAWVPIGQLNRKRFGPLMATTDACDISWGDGSMNGTGECGVRDKAGLEHKIRGADALQHDADRRVAGNLHYVI